MARDTDRKKISETLRLRAGRSPRNQWTQIWSSPQELSTFDLHGHELNITYSKAGRITHLVHWDPIGEKPDLAGRRVIERGKLAHALEVIG